MRVPLDCFFCQPLGSRKRKQHGGSPWCGHVIASMVKEFWIRGLDGLVEGPKNGSLMCTLRQVALAQGVQHSISKLLGLPLEGRSSSNGDGENCPLMETLHCVPGVLLFDAFRGISGHHLGKSFLDRTSVQRNYESAQCKMDGMVIYPRSRISAHDLHLWDQLWAQWKQITTSCGLKVSSRTLLGSGILCSVFVSERQGRAKIGSAVFWN